MVLGAISNSEGSARPQVLTGADFAPQWRSGERLETFFAKLAETFALSPAVISKGRVWSYCELDKRANQFARLLINRGVRPGERVGFCSTGRPRPMWRCSQ